MSQKFENKSEKSKLIFYGNFQCKSQFFSSRDRRHSEKDQKPKCMTHSLSNSTRFFPSLKLPRTKIFLIIRKNCLHQATSESLSHSLSALSHGRHAKRVTRCDGWAVKKKNSFYFVISVWSRKIRKMTTNTKAITECSSCCWIIYCNFYFFAIYFCLERIKGKGNFNYEDFLKTKINSKTLN